MEKKFLQLGDLRSYTAASQLSDVVWNLIIKWNFFEKDTIGKQFSRSIDSISANIAEGFGRYFKKEKIQFYRYAYGSIMESQDWNEKAHRRNLLNDENYQRIAKELKDLPREIHHLIKFTNEKLTI